MLPKAKILAIDDNRLNLDILRHMLAKEYSLLTVASGEEALKVVHEFQPDITILDIMMPGMDGLEVCRKMKADDQLVNNKIIVVSAKAMASERIEGYHAGADDYITKPFDAEELLAKVRVFVRLKSINQNGIHELIELILDPALIVKTTGTIHAVNKLALELFGYLREDFIGRNIRIIIPPEKQKIHEEYVNSYFEKPYTRKFGRLTNLEGIKKNGEKLNLDIVLIPIRTGKYIGAVVAVVRDMGIIQGVAEKITEWMEKLNSICLL